MSDSFSSLLRQMSALGATDLFLSKNKAPAYRINGKIIYSESENLSSENLELFAIGMMNEEQFQQFQQELEINLSYRATGIGRFRVNIFHQKQSIAMVIRAIPARIPTPDTLGIPPSVCEYTKLKRGLILLVGPSGSGKSTTFASLLDQRNEKSAAHIITIEDPIEYIIEHKQSIINQREIGVDTRSYHKALESALRQSPDILGIGEIRTRDTIEHAISFADTGHLCVATLHANNAVQAIERILNFFQESKQEQILLSLSMHIRAIVAQQLVTNTKGQMIPAFEILQSTPRMSDLMSEGDFAGMQQFLEKNAVDGMVNMDQSLLHLYRSNEITAETALENAHSYRNMLLQMRLSPSKSISNSVN